MFSVLEEHEMHIHENDPEDDVDEEEMLRRAIAMSLEGHSDQGE